MASTVSSGFHPTVWGDFFINYAPSMPQDFGTSFEKSEEWMERADQLKEEVTRLFGSISTVVDKMDLVDAIQRLGIDHLFQDQIIAALGDIHGAEFNSFSLHDVALRFRLLRQDGFWVSSDEFNKFKNEDGTFDAGLINDPRGLLSLYNAAHLLTHGETVLEDAISFSRHHLESYMNKLQSPLAEQVKRALQVPLPRTLNRIEALEYMAEYKKGESYNTVLLELAKLDFNLLQRVHLRELQTISIWWKDLYEEVEMSYTRDRIVECYFWSYVIYHEQELSRARIILAKAFALASLLDDTYDIYATLEDCKKLNEAIQGWDIGYTSTLPEYLKKYYVKLVCTFFREVEDELEPHEKFRLAYSRKAFQTLSSCYLQEAEWFHNDYIPSFKEHIRVTIVTGAASALCGAALVGMGDVATKEAFEWVIGCTDAVKAASAVARFLDDISAFKHGKNKKDVATCVESYIKEHKVSAEVAIAKIESLNQDAWKTINQAHLERRAFLPIVKRVASYARSMEFIYLNRLDVYTVSTCNEGTIQKLFVKPLPL